MTLTGKSDWFDKVNYRSNAYNYYSGMIGLKNQKPKYQITHPSGKVAQTEDVQLKLHYNVQPWVGLLTWDQTRDLGHWKGLVGGESSSFQLPAIKTKKKDTPKRSY